MASRFIPLDLRQFKDLLSGWFEVHRRRIDAVHMHHTWRPDHSMYKGLASIVGMHRTHTEDNGWSDIAQHVTIAPDGVIWTGRHWDMPPASSSGMNGTKQQGPFMFEMIGNFDAGKDPFRDPQKDVALRVVALVQDQFNLPLESLKFHRGLGSPKTCPGEAIDYNNVLKEVRARRKEEVPDLGTPRAAPGEGDPVAVARDLLAKPPPDVVEGPDAEPPEGRSHPHDQPRLNGAPLIVVSSGGRAPSDDLDPAMLARLRPHVINLSGGRYSRTGRFSTSAGDVARIFEEELPRRVRALADGTGAPLPILLHAHGGLVPKASGLRTAASQAPWWSANGVYPIHFVWETGFLETLAQMIGVQRGVAARGLEELTDRAVERLVHHAGGPQLWAGMKYAAARAFEHDGAGQDIVEHMARFAKEHAGRFSLHAVGHSAGSIFHSYLLPSLVRAVGTPVETLSLLAPAITVEEYKRRLDPMVGAQIKRLVMFTMAKDWELADTVTPAYRKSLLYLIHHALEAEGDEPILGLEASVRADADLRRRFSLTGADGPAQVVWSRTEATGGRQASRSTTHGGFDNDPATMESVLRVVTDLPDDAQVQQGFPSDAEARSFEAGAQIPGLLVVQANGSGAPTATQQQAANGVGNHHAGGARRALCVGVDAYADPADRLNGCVADARAWEAALANLGFRVDRLHDGAATRDAILQHLGDLIRSSKGGDTLVFQFAGHGLQLDDAGSDEDDGKDEAICPVDYATGRLIIDDDFAALFEDLPTNVLLTCFFDNCHSGTNTRFAVGRPPPPPPGSVARFVVAKPEVKERHLAFRAALGRRRGGRRSTPDEMRQVVFSACKPDEKALEVNGRGDFSVRAIPLLARAGQLSNEAFAEAVVKAFGARPRQHPVLDCAPGTRDAVFLPLAGAARAVRTPTETAPAEDKAAAVAGLLEATARVLR